MQKIKNKLKEIEKKENIEILYAVESGSRAWGFESKDSDYDIRFIYKRPLNWYLGIFHKKDTLEYPIEDSLLDLSGWDLKKTLQLLYKSNPPLYEWLNSSIVYRKNQNFYLNFLELSKKFFDLKSCLYHYLSMAKKNYREYLKKDLVKAKKYFYVLRPLFACSWILKNKSIPPIEFEKLMKFELQDKQIREKLVELLKRKKAGKELDLEPKIHVINDYIDEKLKYFPKRIKKIGTSRFKKKKLLDDFFQKFVHLE